MTNMRQKTTEQKRLRRTRLKRAMQPILERFGCTQAEAAGHVDAMLRRQAKLEAKVIELESIIAILREEKEVECHHES